MGKSFFYSLFSCTLAYLMGAVVLFIIGLANTGFRAPDADTATFMVSYITLALSEYSGWGGFWYLAVLVPWIGSTLLMTPLMAMYGGDNATARKLLGGFTVAAYYVIMIIVFVIQGLIGGWGDIGYAFFPIWVAGGFCLGLLATVIIEKVVRPQF